MQARKMCEKVVLCTNVVDVALTLPRTRTSVLQLRVAGKSAVEQSREMRDTDQHHSTRMHAMLLRRDNADHSQSDGCLQELRQHEICCRLHRSREQNS